MKQTVLAIDPGLSITGFAVMQAARNTVVKDYGIIRLRSTLPIGARLDTLYTFFIDAIVTHTVTTLCLETPFLGKNSQSFMKLGYVRGMLHLIAHQKLCELIEVSPRAVKRAVTGNGAATKEMVKRVVLRLLPDIDFAQSSHKLYTYDVTDALAIGLCGLWSLSAPGKQKAAYTRP